MNDRFDLSRRKLLGSVATIGAAGAIGGAGSMAFFRDEENLANNQLTAGSLDMKVAYDAYYSDWKPNEEGTPEGENVDVRMYNGAPNETGGPGELNEGEVGLPTNVAWLLAVSANDDTPDVDGDGDTDADDAALQFLDNTQYASDGVARCGPDGTDADDLAQPVIELDDVKPGDFGEVTFDFALCDNPGFVWLQGELLSCSENGITEPEAEDEDENENEERDASLWPLAAVGGASAPSLFDSDTREKVSETAEKVVKSDKFSRKDVLKTATAGAAGAAGLGAMAGSAAAAPGDSLASGTLTGQSCCGAGLTFDGKYVYATNFDETEVNVYDPLDGGSKSPIATKTLSDPIDVIEWDPDEEQFWGVQTGSGPEFFLFDLGDPTVTESVSGTSQFTVDPLPDGDELLDGLAYDGSTETLWLSPDGPTTVWQYDKTGTQINEITPEFNEAGDPFDFISGVAVGAPKNGRPTLYIGNNPTGANGDIGRVYADDGEFISTFAASTGFRVEDITCDPITFDGEALLVRDNVDQYEVFEVEEGTCPVSGEPDPEPKPEPTECADVELLDVVQAVAWIDDGDNYQDDDEADAVIGPASLREVLDALGSGVGLGLPGDIPAPDGGGAESARDCFAADEEHSVAFAWWVPVDHGNEIQTDSASFDLGFYTEQCRHNDGMGNNGGGGQQIQCRPDDGFAKFEPELEGQTAWHARSKIADNDAGTGSAGLAELDIRDPGDNDLADAGAEYPADGTAVPWTLTYTGGTAELTVDGQSVSTTGPEPTTGAVGITAKSRNSDASITVADIEYNGTAAGCDVSASGDGDTSHVILEGVAFRDGDTLSGTVAYDANGATSEELAFRVDV